MSGISVLSCSCKSEYQDKKYGAGKRLHNFAVKKTAFRCTICKLEKTGSVAAIKK